MKKQELFSKQAETYLVCFVNDCALRNNCLRWQVGRYTPTQWSSVNNINPMHSSITEGHCIFFRLAEPVMLAYGMSGTFTDDMPQKVVRKVRQMLINEYKRTYYFEYRNGTRPIPPAMQERIRAIFREAGWTQEVQFDKMEEGYDW